MKFPSFAYEMDLWDRGVEFVLGVDEVGRGCFAGPVTAAAVVFRKDSNFTNTNLVKINDSKLVESSIRRQLAAGIKREATFYAISTVSVSIINKFGIGKATQMAIRRSIKKVLDQVDDKDSVYLLADGFRIKHIRGVGLMKQKGIIKGDRQSISIAAASIIAKVHRDRLMRKLSKAYPQYGFYRNKGYGTKLHQLAISQHGLSEIHRSSFNLQKFL